MNRVSILISVGLVAVFLLCFGSVQASDTEDSQILNHPMIGELAPSFSLMDINDQRVSSDDLRGSFVVIHFATSW